MNKVICIKLPTSFTFAEYTLYKIYEKKINIDGNDVIIDDSGWEYKYSKKYFIPLEEWREIKINKILEE